MDMTIGHLVEETGVAARTLREWIRLELLPRPNGYGSGATYTREHLLRIWAIQGLRREGVLLEGMGEALAGMTLRQMARYRPKKAAAAPGAASEGAAFSPGAAAAAGPEPRLDAGGTRVPAPRLETGEGDGAPVASFDDRLPGRRYTLVPLLPGVVLMVDDGVSGFVRRTAQEIVERYAASAG